LSLSKVVAKSLVWTALESFALSGLSLISLFVFARLLSAAEFGIVAEALAIVQVLTVPVELLFHDALIAREELRQSHIDSAFTASAVLGGVVERWMHEPNLGRVLRCMSFSLIGMGFGSVLVAMQRRKLEFRSLALRSLIGRAGSAVIAVSLAFLGAGVWSLVVQQVLLVCLGTLMLWILAEERPHFAFDWASTRELLRFGTFSMLLQLVATLVQRLFMVLVGGYLGSVNAGKLSIAFRGVDMLRDLLAGAVSQIAMPMFSRLRADREAQFDAYNRSVELTTLVTYPLFAGLALCADEVVSVAFGVQWLSAAPYFSVIAVLTLPFFLRMYAAPLLKSVGLPAAPMVECLVEVLFVAVGMVAFGRRSLDFAVLAWALRLLASVPIDMWVQKRATGMGYARQLRGSGVPTLSVLGMAAVVLFVKHFLVGSLGPQLRLVPVVLAGAVAYLGCVMLFDRRLIKELLRFVGQSTPTRS
jgi:O-antigen/teichoic acid export membrane protein